MLEDAEQLAAILAKTDAWPVSVWHRVGLQAEPNRPLSEFSMLLPWVQIAHSHPELSPSSTADSPMLVFEDERFL